MRNQIIELLKWTQKCRTRCVTTKLGSKGNPLGGDKEAEEENVDKSSREKETIDEQGRQAKEQT